VDNQQYEQGIYDGIRIATIEHEAAEEIVHVNDTQMMLIQLALDWAVEDPSFRKAMLQRYDDLSNEEADNG
jgi:hypothetical protein